MPDEPKLLSPDNLKAEQLKALFAFARGLRGLYRQAIWIDVTITDILAHYFAPDEDKRMGTRESF
jgi:hypothetical protein